MNIICLAFLFVSWILLIKLLIFHAYLTAIGSTTYELILKKRSRVINKRILDIPPDLENNRRENDDSRDDLENSNKVMNFSYVEGKTHEFDSTKSPKHNTNSIQGQILVARGRQETGGRLTQAEGTPQTLANLQISELPENSNNPISIHTMHTSDSQHPVLQMETTIKNPEQSI